MTFHIVYLEAFLLFFFFWLSPFPSSFDYLPEYYILIECYNILVGVKVKTLFCCQTAALLET